MPNKLGKGVASKPKGKPSVRILITYRSTNTAPLKTFKRQFATIREAEQEISAIKSRPGWNAKLDPGQRRKAHK